MTMQKRSQAILFLTHVRSARVLAHLERLRRETQALMPLFVCVDARLPRRDTAEGFPADFTVDPADWEHLVPARAAHLASGLPSTDYFDRFYLPALASQQLAGFDHVWFVENDVDFAGDWADFFRVAMESEADLIATTIYPRTVQPRWSHWKRFRTPERLGRAQHIRAFLPLARFSRRLIAAYVEEMQDPAWSGQFEAAWPTIAAERGFTLADPGGDGPFRWDGPSFYSNTFNTLTLSPGTFVFRPIRKRYFYEDPVGFASGQLHHPVKGW
jgi:hypothetical protein